jgi:predicted metalloprotease with PDZ domain
MPTAPLVRLLGPLLVRAALCSALGLGCAVAAEARAKPKYTPVSGVAQLDVDLTEAPRRLVHARLRLPVRPGPLQLAYPQWLPGEHGPTGLIADLVSLQIHAGSQLLAWRRDGEEMYRVLVDVPAGTTELQLSYDFVSAPPNDGGFSSGASMTQRLALLSWNQVVLYPEGARAAELSYASSVRLPPGWRAATSLERQEAPGDAAQDTALIRFKPVSLETLVDSPVLSGLYLNEVPLGESHGAKVSAAIAAETAWEARLPPALKTAFENLVAEEAALFGARHFDRYVFLITLSDNVTHFGLEHHQSNDSRMSGRAMIDPELALEEFGGLLAHESFHSWNGKHRRPAGLATPDYQEPMKGELLWVYEGLTQYYGEVLAARAGFRDAQTARDVMASEAEAMRTQRGRSWRPLQDTAVAAQILYPARTDWASLRRSVDFYSEGTLLWLEVDAILREKSGGAKSLDDFCKKFHGGESGGPSVKPYALEDVLKALGELVPYDWRAHFLVRVQGLAEAPPLEGFTRAGWRLSYQREPAPFFKAREKVNRSIDLRASLGLLLDDKGQITDVVPGAPADRAGLGPAMKVVAVDGRRFTAERLHGAIEAHEGAGGKTTLDLLVENADSYEVHPVAWTEGPRYPRLERIEGKPDLLGEIFKPRAKK